MNAELKAASHETSLGNLEYNAAAGRNCSGEGARMNVEVAR